MAEDWLCKREMRGGDPWGRKNPLESSSCDPSEETSLEEKRWNGGA